VPVLSGAEVDYRLEGARFTGLTARHKQQNLSGVLLDELAPRSRLAREGLAEGDIITGVNRQPVHNLVDFKQALETKRSSILLQIRRGGRSYIARIN
jgi:S1-C subfamily serine protease